MEKSHLLLFKILLLFILFTSSKSDENNNKTIKYLSFPFKRNLTLGDSLMPKQFFQAIIYNQIYIELTVGSQKQKIPFYLFLQQYPMVLQSANAKKDEVKGIYDETKSNTYRSIEEETKFEYEDLVKGMLSTDDFYFDSKPSNIHFYLSIQNFEFSHITEGGKIGFKFYDKDEMDKKFQNLNFIKNLKNNGLISGYEFSFIYDSNNLTEDTGTLYVGAPLHAIDNNKYNVSFFNSTYSELILNGFWGYTFEKNYLGNEIFEKAKTALFYPEFGFIVGTRNFFEKIQNTAIWNEYFNLTKKCHSTKFQIIDMEANAFQRFSFEYTGYYCDKDVNVNKIINENITFYSPGLGNIINFKSEDVWMQKDEYKYFLILETLNTENSWIFGKPFFKKYHMVFNQDSKAFGVYTYINYNKNIPTSPTSNKTVLLVCIIVGLVVVIGALVFLLVKLYNKISRKKKANELVDDNFDYTPSDNANNGIIPSENEGIN